MSDKRILVVNEASFLSSGYSILGRNLIQGLINRGLNVAELSCYASINDPRFAQIPWKAYANMPSNEEEKSRYNEQTNHVFGAFKFEQTCLDFKPTHVLDWRDHWMSSFILQCPYKKMYKTVMMPTVDAKPQNAAWLHDYSDVDAVLTYQDFSKNVLEQQSGGKINVLGSATPSASPDFRPLNKEEVKRSLGFDDRIVVGMVARNQKRKLFPELFRAFRKFLDESGKDVVLHCHTGYPDNGWHIPQLIKEYSLSSNVTFTYHCNRCKLIRAWPFSGDCFHEYGSVTNICPRCNNKSFALPSVQNFVSDEEMCQIFNSFDLYVQYTSCLAPDQKILVVGGWKNIEDIQIGDQVYTHKGRYNKVTNTFKRKHNITINEVSICADFEKLKITNEHPIFGLFQKDFKLTKNQSFKENIGNWLRNKKDIDLTPKFKAIKDIQVGDFIAQKINLKQIDIKKIDLAQFVRDRDIVKTNNIYIKYGNKYNRYLKLNNITCKFIGLFVADGYSNSRGQISVTCHIDEINNINLCKTFFEQNNLKYKIRLYKNRKACDIISHSVIFARFFQQHCKSHFDKQLPKFMEFGSTNQQKLILQGLFMGDGCFWQPKNVTIYFTTSYKLNEQIKILCQRLRINYNVTIRNRPNKHIGYTFEIRGNIKLGKFYNTITSTRNFYHNNYLFRQIKNINQIKYDGYVYNLEVEEDNSYTTKIGSLHNCEGLGIPIMEAAACGIPVSATNYSAMEDLMTKLGGRGLKYHLHKEMETGRDTAIPDEEYFISVLKDFTNLPQEMRSIEGNKVLLKYNENYGWEKAVDKWVEAIEHVGMPDNDWDCPESTFQIHSWHDDLNKLDNAQYTKWVIINVLGLPDKLNSYLEIRLLRDLTYGFYLENPARGYMDEQSFKYDKPKYLPFDKKKAYEEMSNYRQYLNYWEKVRKQTL